MHTEYVYLDNSETAEVKRDRTLMHFFLDLPGYFN
jgi:hypothetical protein